MSPSTRTDSPRHILDRAVASVRGEAVSEDRLEEARRRVWARLSEGPSAEAAGPAAPRGPIRGCDDVLALLPALVAGRLPAARATLVEDHARHCPGCRRALAAARGGGREIEERGRRRRGTRSAIVRRWLPLAAGLLLVAGAALLLSLSGVHFGPRPVLAHVESLEGELLRPAAAPGEAAVRASQPGDALREGEPVRTARGSRALLRLADGSLVEMAERAELSVDRGWRGTTIHLDRGNIIVEAAKQHGGKLYVATGDCLVSVTGTIFTVNHGVKGSRVSVLQGEVRVAQAGGTSVLHPGQQVTTDPSLEPVPLAREVAWSRDRGRYAALLEELSALKQELDARLTRPGLRYDSRLLDLVPPATVGYLALPNLGVTVAEAYQVVQERLAVSPTLAAWWREEVAGRGMEDEITKLVAEVRDLGSYLGDEVVVTFGTGAGGAPGDPVILAEADRTAALEQFLEAESQHLAKGAGGEGEPLVLVSDPASPPAAAHGLFVWVGNGVLVATPSPELLRQVAELAANGGSSGFAATSFGQRLAQAYADGVQFLFGADLGKLAGKASTAAGEPALGSTGVEHLVVERHEADNKTETRASVTFRDGRRGIASWLASPAPMGALDFISSDAHLVTAAVVRDPAELLHDVLAREPDGEVAGELERLRQELGVDVVTDLAAPLGGEVAFALDGPVLPRPSWKLVVEVYDPERLETTLESLVKRWRTEAAADGEAVPELTAETVGGRTYHTLRGFAGGAEIDYLFADGYLVAAPSRALLDRALDSRKAGRTVTAAESFRALLPADGQVNFSALFFQDLAPLAQRLEKAGASAVPDGGGAAGASELRSALAAVSGMPATLGYAYGEPDRLVFASSGPGSFAGLDLVSLLGVGRALEAAGGFAGGGEAPR